MKHTTKLKLSMAVLITAGLLGACGEKAGDLAGESPTSADIEAWRKSLGRTVPGYETESFQVSDLKCVSAPSDVVERIKKDYALLGRNADDTIKAYASCSYTVNAKYRGLHYLEGKTLETKDQKNKDHLFLLRQKDQKLEWVGQLTLVQKKP